MNKEFEVTLSRGTFWIAFTVAGLALLIVALQMLGATDITEVPAIDYGSAGQQLGQGMEIVEAIRVRAPAAARRGWKVEEIGAGQPVVAGVGSETAGDDNDALSLGTASRAAQAAVALEPVERGWKPDEIGAAGSGAKATGEQENALSLASYYQASRMESAAARSLSSTSMRSKLETMLAAEEGLPGDARDDSCAPASPSGPETC